MPESLHTCPDCQQGNFTERGLKAHRGGITCTERAAKLQTAPDDNALMGAQLTSQYHRAVSGMQEVVIFGGMMMQLRERYPELTQRGPSSKSNSTRGVTPADEQPVTLKKWLSAYAPEVKEATAYRFLRVAESVAQDYTRIVGAKTAKAIGLADLVTTPADKLPADFAAKQLELFDWVNGTSQRSWLDRFSPESPQQRGRANRADPAPARNPTAAELAQAAEDEITGILNMLDGWFLAANHTRVSKQTRITTEGLLEEAIRKIRAVK